jgi:transcriptional regulator with XRE-family HTH domain
MTETKETGKIMFTRSKIDVNTISENLRLYRVKRRMTQTDLSVISGVSQNLITYIEQGKRSPNLSSLSRLAEGLEIPTALLLLTQDTDQERANIVQLLDSP